MSELQAAPKHLKVIVGSYSRFEMSRFTAAIAEYDSEIVVQHVLEHGHARPPRLVSQNAEVMENAVQILNAQWNARNLDDKAPFKLAVPQAMSFSTVTKLKTELAMCISLNHGLRRRIDYVANAAPGASPDISTLNDSDLYRVYCEGNTPNLISAMDKFLAAEQNKTKLLVIEN